MKSLYVTDRYSIGDERFRAILRALRGAPGLSVELREKDSTDRECLAWAREARETLGSAIPLFVNRRFDVALAARADGVHLPAAGLHATIRSSELSGGRASLLRVPDVKCLGNVTDRSIVGLRRMRSVCSR